MPVQGTKLKRAIHAGIDPKKISLSAQEIPKDLDALLDLGIEFRRLLAPSD